jgi:hypothetical protein
VATTSAVATATSRADGLGNVTSKTTD